MQFDTKEINDMHADRVESPAEVETALYRHYDAEGVLLYVGISLTPMKRLSGHRRKSHWSGKIARVEMEWHPSRAAAIKAERMAIKKEWPRHNVAMSPNAMLFQRPPEWMLDIMVKYGRPPKWVFDKYPEDIAAARKRVFGRAF